jgi:hypothetical protein
LVLREAERTRIEGIVGGALDKDEDIRYNMEAHSPEGRAAIRRFVDEKIRGRLDSDVYRGQFGDGTRILSEVIPEIRDHLKALGTPGKRTTTGLGQAPGGGDTEVYQTTYHPPRAIPTNRISWTLYATTSPRLNEDANRGDWTRRGPVKCPVRRQ